MLNLVILQVCVPFIRARTKRRKLSEFWDNWEKNEVNELNRPKEHSCVLKHDFL